MVALAHYSEMLERSLKTGNVQEILSLLETALEDNIAALDLIDKGLVPAIRTMGDMFERGELFLPHLMRSAEAMKKGMALLSPQIDQEDQQTKDKKTVILGTVEGDIHDIGKNIVALLLSASGFSVVDLGASVPVKHFIDEIASRDDRLIVVGMTSLLTTTMVQQKVLVQKLVAHGLREKVRVMVGGACVSAEWAAEIGADGYGLNAQEAVRLTTEFTSGLNEE